MRALLLVAVVGCIRANGAFQCAHDSDCANGGAGGRCESTGVCSFSDSSCVSGQRYGSLSGSFSNVCVGAIADAGIIDAKVIADSIPDGPPGVPAVVGFATANAGAVTSLTYEFLVPASDNRYLIVHAQIPSLCVDNTLDVSSVTYGGIALTRVSNIVGTPCGANATQASQWGLVAPPTGTHDVVVTLNGTPPYTVFSGAIALSGVNQTTPVRGTAVVAGKAIASTISVMSEINDLVIDTTQDGASVVAQGGNQTAIFIDNIDNQTTGNNMAASSRVATSVSTEMDWTYGNDDQFQTLALSIEPL